MRKGFNGGVKRHSTKQDCCLTITTKTNKKARFVVVKQQAMVKLRIQTKTPLQSNGVCAMHPKQYVCWRIQNKNPKRTKKRRQGYRVTVVYQLMVPGQQVALDFF
jgi:hypothetical protein